MKQDRLRLALMVLLLCLAAASVAFAVKPLCFRMEKQAEIKTEVRKYMEVKETVKKVSEEKQEPIPYAELLDRLVDLALEARHG